MWDDIVSNFKFAIDEIIWCPGFGSVLRCDTISTGCKISMVTAMVCLISSILSTANEGSILNAIGRFEAGLCLTQIVLWAVLFVNMINWTFQTGRLQTRDLEFGVLFCYVIMLICLFYMAMLISFTEMAHKDAEED